MIFNFSNGGKTKARQTRQLAHFDLIHVMVTAQQQQPNRRLDHFTLVAQAVRSEHQGLDCVLQWHVQQRSHIGTRGLARRGRLCHGLGRCRTCCGGRQRLRLFHIGSVITGWAVNDGVLTRRGNYLKLFAQIPTDGATVRRHGSVAQSKAVENLAISLRHHLVTGLGRHLVAVKGIGILHDELAPTHQAKAGPTLVAELGLDLVKVFGQLLIALDLVACNVRHHLFTGRLNHKITIMAVFDAQQLRPHSRKTPGFLPKLGRLHHRHAKLHSPRTVHLLAHDGLHLAHYTQPHGHQTVDAGPQFFDHAGTRHQLMADHLGVSRCFFESGNKKLGCFHGGTLEKLRATPLDVKQLLCIMDEV